jgi:hypothetical protein
MGKHCYLPSLCVEDARHITQSDQKLTRSHTACYAQPAASALYVLIINWLMALIGIIIIAVAGECVWGVTLCVSVYVRHVLEGLCYTSAYTNHWTSTARRLSLGRSVRAAVPSRTQPSPAANTFGTLAQFAAHSQVRIVLTTCSSAASHSCVCAPPLPSFDSSLVRVTPALTSLSMLSVSHSLAMHLPTPTPTSTPPVLACLRHRCLVSSALPLHTLGLAPTLFARQLQLKPQHTHHVHSPLAALMLGLLMTSFSCPHAHVFSLLAAYAAKESYVSQQPLITGLVVLGVFLVLISVVGGTCALPPAAVVLLMSQSFECLPTRTHEKGTCVCALVALSVEVSYLHVLGSRLAVEFCENLQITFGPKSTAAGSCVVG